MHIEGFSDIVVLFWMTLVAPALLAVFKWWLNKH